MLKCALKVAAKNTFPQKCINILYLSVSKSNGNIGC